MGMFLAALAFVAAALVQVQIDVSKHVCLSHYTRALSSMLIHSIYIFFIVRFSEITFSPVSQQTVPVFPSASEAQVKFLNLDSSVLTISVNGNPHEIQPFQVSAPSTPAAPSPDHHIKVQEFSRRHHNTLYPHRVQLISLMLHSYS